MSVEQQPYVEIEGRVYALPQSFRLGDPVLVQEVTGLAWPEFVDRLDDAADDPTALLGMIAVAVWQGNPRWRRDKVARYVEALQMDALQVVVPDREVDEGPPVETPATPPATSSDDSPEKPSESPEDK